VQKKRRTAYLHSIITHYITYTQCYIFINCQQEQPDSGAKSTQKLKLGDQEVLVHDDKYTQSNQQTISLD